MWLSWERCSTAASACYTIKSKKPFFKDVFRHGEGFGIHHNRPGTAGDFLFYFGTRGFDLKTVSHILPSWVLTLMGQQILGEFNRGPASH